MLCMKPIWRVAPLFYYKLLISGLAVVARGVNVARSAGASLEQSPSVTASTANRTAGVVASKTTRAALDTSSSVGMLLRREVGASRSPKTDNANTFSGEFFLESASAALGGNATMTPQAFQQCCRETPKEVPRYLDHGAGTPETFGCLTAGAQLSQYEIDTACNYANGGDTHITPNIPKEHYLRCCSASPMKIPVYTDNGPGTASKIECLGSVIDRYEFGVPQSELDSICANNGGTGLPNNETAVIPVHEYYLCCQEEPKKIPVAEDTGPGTVRKYGCIGATAQQPQDHIDLQCLNNSGIATVALESFETCCSYEPKLAPIVVVNKSSGAKITNCTDYDKVGLAQANVDAVCDRVAVKALELAYAQEAASNDNGASVAKLPVAWLLVWIAGNSWQRWRHVEMWDLV